MFRLADYNESFWWSLIQQILLVFPSRGSAACWATEREEGVAVPARVILAAEAWTVFVTHVASMDGMFQFKKS